MTSRTTAYWTTTALAAFAFLSGGLAFLLGIEANVEGVLALGFPAHLVTLLGIWKLAGALAILVPRVPLLKEWAYAGMVFDLTGAAYSQLASGHPAAKAIGPLALLAIVVASWTLRPASRRPTVGGPAATSFAGASPEST